MKRIDAIIPEKNLEAVNKSLENAGVTGITVFNSVGRGKASPKAAQMGSAWYYFPVFGNNKVITVLTADGDADKVVQAINENADAGKIIVTNVEKLVDIRNNTKDEQAL